MALRIKVSERAQKLAEVTSPPRRPQDSPLAMDMMHIGAFRGLQNIKLERLSRINLLVGSNNAGKTSILEAIAVMQNPFSPIEWLNVVRMREIRTGPFAFNANQMSNIEALRWIFPAREDDIWGEQDPLPIALQSTASGAIDQLDITCETVHGLFHPDQIRKLFGISFGIHKNKSIESETNIEDDGLILRVNALSDKGMLTPVKNSHDWTIWSQLGTPLEVRRTRSRANVQYLAPYAHRNSSAQLSGLTNVIKKNEHSDINSLLNDLDPNILGVEIITTEDGGRPKIAVRLKTGSLIPMSVLGDGLRRALSIAIGLRTAANGLLLIDEIEAALHVSALDRVYQWLDNAASSFSVQVFATTHSLEAIDAVVRSTDTRDHSKLSGYAINKKEKNGVKRYTGDMLQRLVQERGLDIRG